MASDPAMEAEGWKKVARDYMTNIEFLEAERDKWRKAHVRAVARLCVVGAERDKLRDEKLDAENFLASENYRRCDTACNCGKWHKWPKESEENNDAEK